MSLEYGDLLGDLADTTAALKSHNLNIRRAKIRTKNGMAVHKFYITDARTSEKVVKSARIEEIRLTILDCAESHISGLPTRAIRVTLPNSIPTPAATSRS